MSGRERGEMLRAGPNQVHSDCNACNKQLDKVNDGIYCSPMIRVPIFEYSG